jgi:hypothetical protein
MIACRMWYVLKIMSEYNGDRKGEKAVVIGADHWHNLRVQARYTIP